MASPPVIAQQSVAGAIIDQATIFALFAETTATQAEPRRIAHFHAQFDPLLPGFYRRATPATQAALDAQIAAALLAFPDNRAAFTRTTASFGPAFTAAQERFRQTFADYTLTMPVYLIQSFGQMDGGTRMIGGKPAMLFGADVIAKIHDDTTIGPFLDHELFHIYHARFFPDCAAIWCSLWQEGLAVHVAARMNPGANDRQLELTEPRPIRAELAGRIPQAMCFVRKRLDSTRDRDYAALFLGSGKRGKFPPRFGYLVGAMLAERIGATLTLEEMAKLPPDAVKLRLAAVLASYARC
ncbi:hypothetical protein [Sphingomonas sp.]|uniref:hypothetical protein n=1 Tax=Sphingomonas sp. TaxID=28214 RepID=UPI00333EF491